MLATEMASMKLTMDSQVSLPTSSRKYIDDIPPDIRSKLCTEIDYTIHKNEGYWQKLIGRLGFDETHSKKFRLSFEMHGSPTDNLLRDCSYRMLRIRHLYQILTEIGLLHLAEAYLKGYDTEEPLPPYSAPLFSGNTLRSDYQSDEFWSARDNVRNKGIAWRGIDTYHFSYDEIKAGTKNFSPQMELGAGAFGKVYKVFLNNTLFACKVLKIDKDNELTTSLLETHRQHDDLRNELNYLAEYRHPNVIALYGWSLDGPDPCLIYDYMKNGSLQDRLQCLNNSKPMDWEIRIKVSCGAARGLQFLHTFKSKPLIHGDIKTANILLDNSFTAKLGDFGLAREMPRSATTGSYIRLGNEHTPGTLGYLANEYISTKKLSVQVDTYAFGVVLLELYTGRRAYDRNKETPLLRDYMDDVAKEAEKIGENKANAKLLHLQDPRIRPLQEEPALKFVRIALSCCHEKRKERPKMSKTLEELNEIERMVAIANGKEPEEFVPLLNQDRNPSQHTGLNFPPAVGEQATNTLQRRKWMPESNLSRNPVESVDHSLIGDHIPNKAENQKKERVEKLAPSAIEKALGRLRVVSSSDDSEGMSSTETTTSGFYYDQPVYKLPHDQIHPGFYQQPPIGNQGQYNMYAGSHAGGYSGSMPHHSDQFRHSPHNQGEPLFPHGFVNRRNPFPLKDIHDLYAPGPCSCPASRGVYDNPYKLDLSKVPRPPCICGIYPQHQQGFSPIQSPNHYLPNVDCSPETFNSSDYNDPVSLMKQNLPVKVSSRKPAESSPINLFNGMPGTSNARQSHRDFSDRREASYHASSGAALPQPSSFHFNQSNCTPGEMGYVQRSFSPAHPSVNSVKESIIDKIKEGQSYTQIFAERKKIPTEDDASDKASS